MPDAPQTTLRITAGAPRVHCAHVVYRSETVTLIEVDMHSKRCVVEGSGGDPPLVCIGADEHSLHLDEARPRDAETIVEFADFAGWRVWSAEASRYTVCVTLRRGDA